MPSQKNKPVTAKFKGSFSQAVKSAMSFKKKPAQYLVITTDADGTETSRIGPMEFENAADTFVFRCETFLRITPMVKKEKNYSEKDDHWEIKLERV